MDNVLIQYNSKTTHLKSDFISVLAKKQQQKLVLNWRIKPRSKRIQNSSFFVSLYFEGIFTITVEEVTIRNLPV